MAVGLLSEHASTGPCSVGHKRLDGASCQRWLVAECLSAIIFVSVALAYASPPDPSWISGIYDDRDDDDVVIMVTDATGVNNPQASEAPGPVLAGFVLDAATSRLPHPPARRQTIRGPPIEARDVSIKFLLVYPIFLPCLWLSRIRRSNLTSLPDSDPSCALAYLGGYRHAPGLLPLGASIRPSPASRNSQAEDTGVPS